MIFGGGGLFRDIGVSIENLLCKEQIIRFGNDVAIQGSIGDNVTIKNICL